MMYNIIIIIIIIIIADNTQCRQILRHMKYYNVAIQTIRIDKGSEQTSLDGRGVPDGRMRPW